MVLIPLGEDYFSDSKKDGSGSQTQPALTNTLPVIPCSSKFKTATKRSQNHQAQINHKQYPSGFHFILIL